MFENTHLREGYGDIYCITNNVNGKKYIGQVSHFYGIKTVHEAGAEYRFKEHIRSGEGFSEDSDKSCCVKLCRAIKKYGSENFSIQVLLVCRKEYLNDFEIQMIEEYDTYNNGYNSTIGGAGTRGIEYTPEYRKKLSDSKKGDRNPNKNGLGELHKKRIGAKNAFKRRKLNDETILEILSEKPEPEELFVSQQQIADKYDVKPKMVSDIWIGKLKPYNESLLTDKLRNKYSYKVKKQMSSISFGKKEMEEVKRLRSEGKLISEIMEMVLNNKGRQMRKDIVIGILKGRYDDRTFNEHNQ